MPDQERKKEPIKVTDRRSFTQRGERRSQESPALDTPVPPGTVLGEGFRMRPSPDEARSKELPGSHFNLLILSLSSTAFMQLGEMADPTTGRTEAHLDGARHTIDLIEMLREKTRGNLTAEETQLITGILAELKLAYVRKASAK